MLAVAGHNEKAHEALQAIRAPRGSTLRAFGFVKDMASLMAAADLFVGKSGGSTTAECLAMGLPMIVCDPIPGQEERNCDFLLEAGPASRPSVRPRSPTSSTRSSPILPASAA